ncbi:hypothetical protein pdul_cds_909 [Pandoravirus dulcis]|uniref:Uncharacterized protein n=1 Tax=Pandoravirus dulcis TaxID=1349409 RepID=S4VZ57_9VIRU|nr:hypothetical protein pdul_cds_909 [Pandoravirus dulcis]AGO83144.2 hypothetical protein pdul_cds_909 [Pandoravirus dulcis]
MRFLGGGTACADHCAKRSQPGQHTHALEDLARPGAGYATLARPFVWSFSFALGNREINLSRGGQTALVRKTTSMTDLLDGLIKRGITALDFAYEKDGQPAGCLLLDHVPPAFDTGSGRFAALEMKQRNDKFRVEGSLSHGRFRLLVLQDGHTLTATLRYAEPWAEYGGEKRLTVEVHEKKKN